MGDKRIFILGAGKSGIAAARMGLDTDAEVFLFDDRGEYPEGKDFEELVFFGLILVPFEKRFDCLDVSNLVIVSPGIPPENELYKYARTCGKIIKSELEFAFDVCSAPVIAITGTNGKTTTTALTAHLLSGGGFAAHTGGNIGRPFSDFARTLSPDEVAVLETSSFMLETVSTLRPRVSALLNITPDHLDRYKSMEEYTAAKLAVFKNQTADDYAVLNADDAAVVKNTKKIKAQKYCFSREKKTKGAHIVKEKIYFGDEYVCDASAVKIIGKHNMENALAAVTIAKIFHIENGAIERGLITFKAVPHRIEFVASGGGVKFYNDSKATNIDSALVAANSVSGFSVMILGGSDKGYEYDGLFQKLPPHIERCVFIGAVTDKLVAAADRTGYKQYIKCGTLKEAVEYAAGLCGDAGGGTVLLSPAAASFDMFRNFEERGDTFKKIVREYVGKN